MFASPRPWRIPVVGFVLVLLGGIGVLGVKAETVVERVVASVNGEPILWSEVEAQRMALIRGGVSADYAKVLDMLVEDKLLKFAARKAVEDRKIEVGQGEVEFEVKQMRDQFESEEAFVHQVEASGLTLDQLRERLRRDLEVRKLMHLEVYSKITVTDADVEKYYQEHQSQFTEPDVLRLRVLRLTEAAQVQAVEKALKAGTPFLDLVKKYGDEETKAREGLMGEVNIAEWKDHLRLAVEPLRTGEVSGAVSDGDAWYFFKVEDRVPGRQLTLVDTVRMRGQPVTVKEGIRQTLQNQMIKDRMEAWLAQLRAAAAIEKKPLN